MGVEKGGRKAAIPPIRSGEGVVRERKSGEAIPPLPPSTLFLALFFSLLPAFSFFEEQINDLPQEEDD